MMEPKWSHEDGFSDYLAELLEKHDTTMDAVKAKIHATRSHGKPTSMGQLASIRNGRRAPGPKAILEIADALGQPEAFPDYNLAQLRYRLDPTEVGWVEAARYAEEILRAMESRPEAARKREADALRKRAQRQAERPEGVPDAKPTPRRRKGQVP